MRSRNLRYGAPLIAAALVFSPIGSANAAEEQDRASLQAEFDSVIPDVTAPKDR